MKKSKNRENIANFFKPILSRPPLLTLFVIFSTILYISTLVGASELSVKAVLTFMYITLLGFYLTGKAKNIIWYFISLIIIIVLVSLSSLQLEAVSKGITGINFPSALFTFFFSGFLLETFLPNTKTSIKTFISFVITALFILGIAVLYSLYPTLNHYIIISLALIINLILGAVLYFRKKI
jgi:hypothetical protein